MGLNVSFMNLSEIQERACGMDERRFRRAEVRLEEAGLVIRRLSANGRRFPERDMQGNIINAFGIDLSPLLNRYAELLARKEAAAEKALAMRHRRNDLSARVSALLRLYRDVPASLIELRDTLRNALRRAHPSDTQLDELEQELTQAEAKVAPPTPSPEPAPLADETAVDDGQTVRHIDPKQKENNMNEVSIEGIQQAWEKTKTLKQFHPTPPNSLRQICYSLLEFAGYIAVKKQTLEQFLEKFGVEETVRVLDHMATNFDRIGKPDGYLGSMLRSPRDDWSLHRRFSGARFTAVN
jgi:replication initiation protein RepC